MSQVEAQQDVTGMWTARLLRERGWTAGMICKFLPTPDETVPNPHHPNGRPMRLFDPARVEAMEINPEVALALAAARARHGAA